METLTLMKTRSCCFAVIVFHCAVLAFGRAGGCALAAAPSIPAAVVTEKQAAKANLAWDKEASRQTFYMIGNGHIDPVWLWPWQEGVSLVHATFRSALDRMNETSDFTFTASSALFYEWVAQNDPAMLVEIRRRITEGRWTVVGGWWIEPDLNIPSGEALMRQGLYGQRSLKYLLGRRAVTGFNPDGFGHPGTLPQILQHQGLENYVFMRPNPDEKKLPASTFWWESPDGSRVLTYRIPISYGDKGLELRERVQKILELPAEPLPLRMAFYGVGDHGGGSTKANIASIIAMQSEKNAPRLIFSSPDAYFKKIRETSGPLTVPVVRDDLQHHAVGCYTAHSEIKKLNRQSEIALLTAEKITSIGSAAWENVYPKREFTAAWKRVLFQQFHDSLAGTSLPEHYDYARAAYGSALAESSEATYLALQKLAWQVPTADSDSDYYIVFNPHAWPATLDVEQEFKFKKFPDHLEDETGRTIPFQLIIPTTESDRLRQRFLARVELPAFGYRQIRFSSKPDARNKISTVNTTDTSLENEHLRVTFDAAGRMTLLDKKTGAALIQTARALVLDDPTDTWSHRTRAYDTIIGEFDTSAEIKTTEQGAVRKTVRVRNHYGTSTLTINWMLYAHSRALEARVTIDWREKLKLLKLSFPTGLENTHTTTEVAYGVAERATNGNEEPGHRWINMTGTRPASDSNTPPSTRAGLALINDAKYGYSATGGDLRVTIVRSPPYALHRKPDPKFDYHYWMDQGVQTFRIKLIPHDGDWTKINLPRLAEEFTTPTPILLQGIHTGTRPQSASLLSIDADNIIITAIKQAEDNDDLVFRCYETAGRATNTTLTLHFAGKTWSGYFRAHEIKTLRLDRTNGTFHETGALEEK